MECAISQIEHLQLIKSPKNPLAQFIYSKVDFPRLSNTLVYSLQHTPTEINNVQATWQFMKRSIIAPFILHIPTVSLTAKPFPKWFTPAIRHKINCTRTLHRSLSCNPSSFKLTKLAQLEQDLDHLILTCRQSYELDLIKSHHRKKLYRHLKSLSYSNSPIPIIIHNSQVIHNPAEKATTFNNYFNSIFSRSSFTLPPIDQLPTPTNQLHTIPLDNSETLQILSNLDPFKSPGCDDLSPKVLKECTTSLAIPLTTLLQASLQNSSIPNEWKIHLIIPIHKGGHASNVTNYRPILFLCILSKVFETIISNKIINFIWPQISSHQFGFLRNRSCLTQLLTSYSNIYSSLDAGICCDVAHFDFKKAFDTAPHNELLLKLWMTGITGPL